MDETSRGDRGAAMNVQPIPKNKRYVDKTLPKRMKKELGRCEGCGSRMYLEWAHIISKGAGGPDMRENGCLFCGPACLGMGCHGADHRGEIGKERMWRIAAKREGISVAECKRRVRRAMGYAVD